MQYFLLVLGFLLLIKGADFFVDGSSGLAKRLRVPTMIVGLTVVAMGTSLPEASVSIAASVAGKNDLAISNAIGSNIFNLLIVCGICAAIIPITIKQLTIEREFPFSMLVAGALLVFCITGRHITRLEGLLLLGLFALFMMYTLNAAQRARGSAEEEPAPEKLMEMWQCLIYIVLGIAALAVGGRVVVSAASHIAHSHGVSDNVIGLTIVAAGTSLPELFTSVLAALRKETDIALGNIIGSNIFNILFVLGTASLVSPISISSANMIDIVMFIMMSVVTFWFCKTNRKLVQWEGGVLIGIYVVYILYICAR